jgi:hypothetical protein
VRSSKRESTASRPLGGRSAPASTSWVAT